MLKLRVVCPDMSAALRNQVQSFLLHHTSKQMRMAALILWMWLMERMISSHKKHHHTVISQYFSGKLLLQKVLRKCGNKLFQTFRQGAFFCLLAACRKQILPTEPSFCGVCLFLGFFSNIFTCRISNTFARL